LAFIALQAAMIKPSLTKATSYFDFAQKQLNYLLGDTGRSFVVGFGKNPPTGKICFFLNFEAVLLPSLKSDGFRT
jgi:hypothetical protein